ncbi:hypothetical protein CFBP498_05750 [Xanthomonas hortorum pv. vitians]|uniref:Uncharacterized protein n=1 Tax=Xanthomonas hortorum pv. vitians TaxID=83224 RepID=A0A6V7BRN2_9XANT|nr:hypothetical protein CFBP498_05750 [Xanthomonas hortorum pv. vitians]CAD0304788.1 hypothetical protein CFBP498_05750 [Xanthomonas hortorum pv. vitians]
MRYTPRLRRKAIQQKLHTPFGDWHPYPLFLPSLGCWRCRLPELFVKCIRFRMSAGVLARVSDCRTLCESNTAAGPVGQGGLCHASIPIPPHAGAQARHGAAAHRDRLALARTLDHPAALPRAQPHPRAPPRSQQAAPPRPPACPATLHRWLRLLPRQPPTHPHAAPTRPLAGTTRLHHRQQTPHPPARWRAGGKPPPSRVR